VLDGSIKNNSLIDVKRGDDYIISGRLTRLQSGKQDVDEVLKDQEAGLKYEGKPLVEVGDILVVFQEERVVDKL